MVECWILLSYSLLREIYTITDDIAKPKGRKPPTRTALCVLSHRTITIYTHDPFDTLRTHRGTCPAARTSRSTSTPPRDITAARTRDHMRFSGHARGLTREMRLTYHSDLVLLWVLGEFHAPTRPLTTTLSSSRSRASITPAGSCRRTRCSHPPVHCLAGRIATPRSGAGCTPKLRPSGSTRASRAQCRRSARRERSGRADGSEHTDRC